MTAPRTMPRASLIANARAGSVGLLGGGPGDLARRLEARGIAVVRKPRGSIARQIERSVEDAPDIVVVAGGDGSINAAANAHRGTGRPIGIVPLGTMNLLARDFGIPLDVDAALDVVARGHTVTVAGAELDGHLFLHSAFVGLPVRIGTHREARRGALGILSKLRLLVHAFRSLTRDPMYLVRAEPARHGIERGSPATGSLAATADEGPHDPRGGTATLARPPALPVDATEGISIPIRGRSVIVMVGEPGDQLLPVPMREPAPDGSLTVIAIRPPTRLAALRVLFKGIAGTLDDDEDVSILHTRSARVISPRRHMHAMLDGEKRLVSGRARLRAVPDAMVLLADPSRSPAAAVAPEPR